MANIGTTAVISKERFAQQGSAPTAPDAGYWLLYVKSGGLYYKDSANNEYQVGKAADATTIQGNPVDSTAPIGGQVLVYNTAAAKYVPTTSNEDGTNAIHLFDDFVFGTDNSNGTWQLAWQLDNCGTVRLVPGSGLGGPPGPPGPGVLQVQMSAPNVQRTSFQSLYGGQNGSVLFSSLWDFTCYVNTPTAGANERLRIGLSNDFYNTDPPTTGAYFEILTSDTHYFGVTRNAGTQTRTTSLGVTLSDGLYHRLRVRRIDSTHIGFTVDGGTEVVSTTNLPASGGLAIGFQMIATNASAHNLNLDYVDVKVTGLAR